MAGKKEKTYIITGVTGMIGGLLVKELTGSAEYRQGKVRIIGLVRNRDRLAGELKNISGGNVNWIMGDCGDSSFDYTNILKYSAPSPAYMIHCASPTDSSYMVSCPAETVSSIVTGTRNMLELAKRLPVESMVYLSSMEVYGQVEDIGRFRSEEELGYLALDSARSSYPLGKRMAEHCCHIWQQEYGVPVKIARLAQTFGKGVRKEDNRVYMQFARAVVEKRDIVLYTKGDSIGNYCASEDTVQAILTILEKGSEGEVYNVVNEANTMSVREMAELVAVQIAGGKIKVRNESRELWKMPYPPATGLRMSGKKLRDLGWMPEKNLVAMYEDVINTLL